MHTIQQLREYADSLERAIVHGDMGLSMLHSDAADLLRWAAERLSQTLEQPESADAVDPQVGSTPA